jgi:hypothetical protein
MTKSLFTGVSSGRRDKADFFRPGIFGSLIVGKGDGGGEIDQGKGDDDPGDDDQGQEQGIKDDAAAGVSLHTGPEPLQDPDKLL